MIRKSFKAGGSPRGAILPIVAMLMVVFIGMLGFAFDLGRVAVCRAQLQGAADAAALAGASALGDDALIMSSQTYNQSTDITSAQALAQKFGQANGYDLNGQNAIVINSSSDVTAGFLSSPISPSSTFSTSSSSSFNAIRVQSHIDSTHGGDLKLLFAPVINNRTATLQATSIAVVQLFQIDTMQAVNSLRCPILPITMSLADWQKMVNNQTGLDNFKYNASTGQVVAGSDGIQEQQLYPGSNGTASNNGLLQFGTSSHSNSVLSDEIINGPDSSQMLAQWPSNGSPPWNAKGTFTMGADPGWRASDFDALAQAVGQVRVIPINDGTSPGNGANGVYTIVMLAPVRILSSIKGGNGKGSSMVQPGVINDPTVVPSQTTLATSGQGGVPIVRLAR